MVSKTTLSDLIIRELTESELKAHLDVHFTSVFRNRSNTSGPGAISEQSKMKIEERRKSNQSFQLRLGVFSNDEFVGWHYGHALDAETYYMQNSAVLEKYRRCGLYSLLLKLVISKIAAEGFQVITSTHHGNNAAVLIPKLKQGFMITGAHFHERFKFLIELKYFVNEERRKAFGQSMGLEL